MMTAQRENEMLPLVDALASTDGRVHVQTRFGEFEADPRSLVTFPAGIPGFETCRRFIVLSSLALAPLQCLHAIDGTPASFLVVDPRLVMPQYRCLLSEGDRARLGATERSVLLWLVVVTIDQQDNAYANLRAPIVVNPSRMVGYQVLPYNSLYPVRQPL
jgi:flagellar assembly factor FliW